MKNRTYLTCSLTRTHGLARRPAIHTYIVFDEVAEWGTATWNTSIPLEDGEATTSRSEHT